MNYKIISNTLAFQKAKGYQWLEVHHNELLRLALLGVQYESRLTRRAVDGALCPRCEHPLNVNWHYCAECGEIVPPCG
jgi:hypothetical protein